VKGRGQQTNCAERNKLSLALKSALEVVVTLGKVRSNMALTAHGTHIEDCSLP